MPLYDPRECLKELSGFEVPPLELLKDPEQNRVRFFLTVQCLTFAMTQIPTGQGSSEELRKYTEVIGRQHIGRILKNGHAPIGVLFPLPAESGSLPKRLVLGFRGTDFYPQHVDGLRKVSVLAAELEPTVRGLWSKTDPTLHVLESFVSAYHRSDINNSILEAFKKVLTVPVPVVVYVTGHSLGAAYAAIAAKYMVDNHEKLGIEKVVLAMIAPVFAVTGDYCKWAREDERIDVITVVGDMDPVPMAAMCLCCPEYTVDVSARGLSNAHSIASYVKGHASDSMSESGCTTGDICASHPFPSKVRKTITDNAYGVGRSLLQKFQRFKS